MNEASGFRQKVGPVIVLLVVITALAIWFYYSGMDKQSGIPEITPFRAILLIVVGFIAGILGGLIGTAGPNENLSDN